MYVLGIDTSTKVAGAALVKDGHIISERFIHNKLTHSQVLVSMVDQVIKDAGITVKELEGVALTRGPGSFTGLRIGMVFAKTLAQILKLRVVAVSTLEVLAANVQHFPGLICPILDARKKEVYTSVYTSREGIIKQLLPPQAISVEGLVEELEVLAGKAENRENEMLFLGDGVPVYFEELKSRLGTRVLKAEPLNLFPRAGGVALLGSQKLLLNQGDALDNLAPVYLRRSEAEITWEKKRGESADEENCCHDLCTPR